MAKKPEANFVQRIHRKIRSSVHKQAMGGTLFNGTPDYYYEGCVNHMWIEYKWYPSKPRMIDLSNQKKKPCLSTLQLRWLQRAWLNKVKVAVVAGYPGGCFILIEGEWTRTITDHIEDYDYPIEEVIRRINGLAGSSRNSRSSEQTL